MRAAHAPELHRRALELYPEHGAAATARILELPIGTVSGWATKAGLGALQPERTRAATEGHKANAEKRRADLAEHLLTEAEEAVVFEREKLATADLRDVVGARTRAIHDYQLLTGQATSRTESVTTDAVDREIQALEAELADA